LTTAPPREANGLALADLHRKVASTAGRVVEVAAARERDDLAGALRAELDSRAEASTVVVVAGETKRGKSSLINALLGQPDLLPVDADIATGAYILVRHGPRTSAAVLLDESPAGREVPVEELAEWVTPRANPDNVKGVRGVVVSLDHPLLAQGVVLVDTPGTGGLEAAHGAVTKAALRTADVLIFVVDASAPLSRPELRFLEESTDRIETVIFALTKRDAYRGWEQVLADDRALLAQTRYARAPFFPVSSTLALDAVSLPARDELHRLMRTESGLDDLEAALSAHAVGAGLALRTANLLRLAQSVLQRLDELEQAVIQAAGEDAGASGAELQAAQRRAAEFRAKRTQGWRVFEREMRAVAQDADLDLNRALADLRTRYETKIADGDTKGIAAALEHELRAIMLTVNVSLAHRVAEALVSLRGALDVEGLQNVDLDPITVGDNRDAALPALKPKPTGGGVIDAFASVSPAYMVTMAGVSFLGMSAVLVAGPLGLLLGGAIWTKRKSMQHQQQARGLLMEAVDWARRELPPALRDELSGLRDAVEAELLAAVERRERELADGIAECERMARQGAEERKRRRAAAVERRKHVVELRSGVAALRAELGRAASVTPPQQQHAAPA
jgi:signal recognition particle receptor subunit beta